MKKKIVINVFVLCAIILNSCSSSGDQGEWHSLFNGKELPAFHHYLGIPDSSVAVPGLKKDSLGNYVESLGWTDPLKVYSVDTLDGEPVIRISGEVIGGLILADSMANYQLKLKFKWGNIKWAWMQGRPKDGGILYHGANGCRHEFQIHEGDVGSYWAQKVILDIPARYTAELPEAILKARPFLQSMVSTLRDTMLIFDTTAALHHFEGKKEWQIVIANPYNEKPHGEWNTLELICYKNHAVHIVNGKVNMIILNSFVRKHDSIVPVSYGRLALQSEGAEIFFKDILLRDIKEMPEEIKKYISGQK